MNQTNIVHDNHLTGNEYQIMKIANERAMLLGYQLGEFQIIASKEKRFWKIYYKPLKFQLGGDLTIFINQNGKVKKVERGQ
ncbi:hypothetical protein FJZ31_24645 [Candidatus Poribacteria bacterium]|nr:hypothetical protein [Candidatus Poribacteria bacterium]